MGRFVIIGGNRAAIDDGFLRQVTDRKIDIIHGQNLIDENVKFMFVITAGMSLFYLVTSVRGLTEEIRVVINEHRNGKNYRYIF